MPRIGATPASPLIRRSAALGLTSRSQPPAARRRRAAGGGDQDGQPGAVAKATPGAVQAEVLVLRVLEAPQRIGQLWGGGDVEFPQPQS